tara:strand:+ start:151 stop:486 length:336 start_codon:yes stop_codon:yes gene_type:complete
MKEIKAYIKPKRAQVVIEALTETGFKSMTISQAEGTGAHKAKGAAPSLDFHITDSPVVKLELVCQNEEVEKAVQLIIGKAKTADPGDGIIYITTIIDAYSIKTGESLRHEL